MKKEQVLQAYQFRHATKEFDGTRKISDDDFSFILETGRLSPSSFGFEPWTFLIVQNPELRRKLLPVTWGAQKTLPTASHFMLILSRTAAGMNPQSGHIQHMMKDIQQLPEEVAANKAKAFHNFLESDFGILANERTMFEWASRQSYIALGNMMTSAALIGIDSCPIEGFDKAKVEDLLAEEGLLDKNSFGISCMVAFGYRVRDPRPKTRQTIQEVVKWVL